MKINKEKGNKKKKTEQVDTTTQGKEEQVNDSEQSERKGLTLKEKYTMLEHEIESIMDQKMRIAAEFDNFRRRTQAEKADWIKNATERLVLEICEVRDNFERALHPEHDNSQKESFRKGIEMIYSQLEEVLKKEGVTKIDALHREFDPNFHDALAHIPSEKKENIVVAVIQNGYIMNKKVIRAAKVAVSNGNKPIMTENNKEEENKDDDK